MFNLKILAATLLANTIFHFINGNEIYKCTRTQNAKPSTNVFYMQSIKYETYNYLLRLLIKMIMILDMKLKSHTFLQEMIIEMKTEFVDLID